MGFGRAWNEMVGEAQKYRSSSKGTSASATPTRDFAAEQTEREKTAIYRDLLRYEYEWGKDHDHAKLERDKLSLQERVAAVKARNDVLKTGMELAEKHSEASLRAYTSAVSSYQSAVAKLQRQPDTYWASREVDRLVTDSRATDVRSQLAHVLDGTRSRLTNHAEPAQAEALATAINNQFGADAVAAYDTAGVVASAAKKGAESRASALASLTPPPPPKGLTTQADIDKFTRDSLAWASDPAKQAEVSQYITGSLGKTPDDLEKEAKELETKLAEKNPYAGSREALGKELGVPGEVKNLAPQSRYAGLSQQQLTDMLTNPSFQRWAEERGFTDVGTLAANGQFYEGKDTAKALRAALSERVGGGVSDKMVGAFKGEVVLSPEPAKILAGGQDPTGSITTVWSQNPDGSLDYVDLASGITTRARNRDGSWTSGSLRTQYGKDLLKDGDPVLDSDGKPVMRPVLDADGNPRKDPVTGKDVLEAVHAPNSKGPREFGIQGSYAMTLGEIKALGDKDGGIRDPQMYADGPEELSGKRRNSPSMSATGTRLATPIGQDPDLYARVLRADGVVVTLTRSDPHMPWEAKAGEFPDAEPLGPELGKLTPTKVNPKHRGEQMTETPAEDATSTPAAASAGGGAAVPVGHLSSDPLPKMEGRIIPAKEALAALFSGRKKDKGQEEAPASSAPVRISGPSPDASASPAVPAAAEGAVAPAATPAKAPPGKEPGKVKMTGEGVSLEDLGWGGEAQPESLPGLPMSSLRGKASPAARVAPEEEVTAEDLGIGPSTRYRPKGEQAAWYAQREKAVQDAESARSLQHAFSPEGDAEDEARKDARATTSATSAPTPSDIQDTLDTLAPGEQGEARGSKLDALRKARELARLKAEAKGE